MNRAIKIHDSSSSLTNQIESKGWTILMHQLGTSKYHCVTACLQRVQSRLRGFSASNIRKMRIFYQAWNRSNTICPSLSDKFRLDQNSNNFFSILPDFEMVSQPAAKWNGANCIKLVSLKEKHTGFAFSKMDYLAPTIIQQLKTNAA